jgi:hypothetical protein
LPFSAGWWIRTGFTTSVTIGRPFGLVTDFSSQSHFSEAIR